MKKIKTRKGVFIFDDSNYPLITIYAPPLATSKSLLRAKSKYINKDYEILKTINYDNIISTPKRRRRKSKRT